MNISISNEARGKTCSCLFSSYLLKTAYEPYVSLQTSYSSLKTDEFHRGKKKKSTLCSQPHDSRFRCFSHNSTNTFRAIRSENDTEFPRASEGSGAARPRQPAGAGSALRPPACPAASRRLGGVTSRGVSGTYVTPRGRRRCCFSTFPKTNPFPRPPTPSVSWDKPAPAAVASFPRSCSPRRQPSLPAGGTRRCPSPAAGQRSPAPPPTGELLPSAPPRAAPGSQHGRGRAAGVPAEKGSARKVSLSLPGRPQPKPIPSCPEHGRTVLLTRYSPLRPPPALFAARPRSYTPRRGTGSGTPPGGAGPPPSWAGRSSASAASCLPAEPWAGRARRGGSADPDPWVAPRGRGMLQAGQLPRGVF